MNIYECQRPQIKYAYNVNQTNPTTRTQNIITENFSGKTYQYLYTDASSRFKSSTIPCCAARKRENTMLCCTYRRGEIMYYHGYM